MIKDKRIVVIIGHYGSGKTEFAINYALRLAKEEKKVALADLDIVNPYFRSREKQNMLEEKGVLVIGSSLGNKQGVDLPAISARIFTPLQDESYHLVMDVGGNDVGALALARYTKYFTEGNYDIFCVINGNRPETDTVQGAINHIASIEKTTGVKITGIINNTHLLKYTTVKDVLIGEDIAVQVSERLNIQIKYVSAVKHIADALPENIHGEVFTVAMHMREEWMK
jgi:energy-coupling factor transporter ATP-binding protein EcfA2